MRWVIVLAMAGCAYGKAVEAYTPSGAGHVRSSSANGLHDYQCFDPPDAPRPHLRHWRNTHLWTTLQAENRGYDLIASETDEQVLHGKLAHWVFDKAIEDEDVALFACGDKGWEELGTARTDEDGRFGLHLAGTKRLGVGMRDIYVRSPDGDDFRFLAFVAPRGTPLVVSDIDGTLTHSEGAFQKAIQFGGDVDAQPDAAASFRDATEKGYQLVYVTARGDRFTDSTRKWLAEHGFPRGPIRLGRPLFVMPGADTIEYKWDVVVRLRHAFEVAAVVGNRRSDIEAYRMAGMPARRTFVKLPEFERELEPELANHRAIGFSAYGPLPLPRRDGRPNK
jgi:hypothetical protein